MEFSRKYNKQHAEAYFKKHSDGISRRLSNHRDMVLAKKAITTAGNPNSILDLPCGTGRFFPVLTAADAEQLIAGDLSSNMLQIARERQNTKGVLLMNTSAFHIALRDDSVDTIFCMRLIHHLGARKDRIELLSEFFRVCRYSVCISLWVDGNLQAYRRKRLEQRRSNRPYVNRFVMSASAFEEEAEASGFVVKARFDMLPWISMWRVYVLSKVH